MSGERLTELIRDIEYAMFTTVDDDGLLRSRPLATLEVDSDRELCFFTSESLPKVGEVAREHRVNLAYADPKTQRYVSVSGIARVSRDHERMKRLWRPQYRAWFPKGLDEPDLVLLCVEVVRAEYWDSPPSTIVHAIGLAKAMITGERYEGAGEHEKLERRSA
ncbi:MAG TPA: pyridoxamine 5'-phosphate oxidase family protein [Burkholderiaceae bacterium]|nr:pyridoxamine 5'-phosphate oxidase family protein [Burkholderiaceae bacterium]